MAYSGSVNITSNYEGVKYKYLMYKDGNNINIDELFREETTDRNGLEVMVYIKNGDLSEFREAIRKQLPYFENLFISFDRLTISDTSTYAQSIYVEPYKKFADEFNNLKIKKYKTFSVNSLLPNNAITLCLGKIQYPLNITSLSSKTQSNFTPYPISINFEIGELDVTPNREQILYSKKNIDIIEKRLVKVQAEIDDIIKSQTNTDFTDFKEYIYQISEKDNTIMLLDEKDIPNVKFLVPKTALNLTYLGKSYSDNILKLYQWLYKNHKELIRKNLSFIYKNGKLHTKFDNFYLHSFENIFNKNFKNPSIIDGLSDRAYIASYGKLNALSKNYIRQSNIDNILFFKKVSKYKLIKDILKSLDEYISTAGMYSKIVKNKEQLKLVVEMLLKDISAISEFSDNDVPATYIAQVKAAAKLNKANSTVSSINWNQEVNLFVLRESDRTNYDGISITSDATRMSLKYIKTVWNKFPVIYSIKDDYALKELCYLFKYTNGINNKYRFVEIAPTKIKILEQFPNFISIEKFMSVNYKRIRMLATARLLKKEYPQIEKLYYRRKAINEISTKFYDVILKLQEYIVDNSLKHWQNKELELYKDIDEMCKKHKYYDEEIMGYVKKNHKLLENFKFLTLFPVSYEGIPKDLINFAVKYILTEKLFTPDITAVKKLREETIFNIKKENI